MSPYLKLIKKILLSNFSNHNPLYRINFAITYNCNARCKICNIWKSKSDDELTTEEVNRMWKRMNISWLSITGGEPFLRNDLTKIVASAIENMDLYLININTNGLLEDRILEFIDRFGNISLPKIAINISLDGFDKIHDRIRGVDGTYQKIIELFKKTKSLERKNNIEIYFSYTASNYNKGKFIETIEHLKKDLEDLENGHVHYNIYNESSFYYKNCDNSKTENFNFSGILKEIDCCLELHKKRLSLPDALERKYLLGLKDFLLGKKPFLRCGALKSSCFIDPQGNVYPCIFFNKKIGNLRDHDYNIEKIWHNELAKQTREDDTLRKCPSCWTSCEAYQAILGNLRKFLYEN